MTYEETKALISATLDETETLASVEAWIESSGLDEHALQETIVMMGFGYKDEIAARALAGGAFQLGWMARGLRERKTYENGERSGYADWIGALADFCEEQTPEEGWLPSSTVKVIQELVADNKRLSEWIEERDQEARERPM